MIKNVATISYEIARLPLVLVDKTLSSRLPEGSGTGLVLDRAIGAADKLAGAVLRNPDLAQRGAERVMRSEDLATAARLEEDASVRREQARKTATAGRQEAARKRKAAQERAASGLQEADVAEARGKQEAKAKAAKSAAKKKADADAQAARRTAAAEKRKESAESAAKAKQEAARDKAKTELDDARKTKQAADQSRADAERLSELAEAKQEQRKKD